MNVAALEALYVASGLLVLWIGWYKAVRPRWRRFWGRVGGALDTLVGRDEIPDYATGKNLPSLPALPDRLARIEETQAQQAEILRKVATALERLGDHERRLKVLEDAAGERIASRLETTALLTAVARRDDELIDVPTTEGDPQ